MGLLLLELIDLWIERVAPEDPEWTRELRGRVCTKMSVDQQAERKGEEGQLHFGPFNNYYRPGIGGALWNCLKPMTIARGIHKWSSCSNFVGMFS